MHLLQCNIDRSENLSTSTPGWSGWSSRLNDEPNKGLICVDWRILFEIVLGSDVWKFWYACGGALRDYCEMDEKDFNIGCG